MSNHDGNNGPTSESNKGRNSANDDNTISSANKETEKPKEQNKMFQREIRSDINLETKNITVAECRNLKDEGRSPRNRTPRDTTVLTFSAQNLRNNEMRSTTISNNRQPLQPIKNETNTLNIQKPQVYCNNNGIAYPPSLLGNKKKFDEENMKLPLLKSKWPMKENQSHASNKRFVRETSNSLPEENLECDSLAYGTDQQTASCPQPQTRFGPTTIWSTRQSFDETKLQNVVETHHIGNLRDLKPTLQNKCLSEELLKSLHEGKCELTTDGPTTSTNMTDFLAHQLIPALQQQENETHRIMDQSSDLMKENEILREKIKQLECEHKNQLQTREAGRGYPNQHQEHYSIQVSEETEAEETNLKHNTSQEIQQLREMNEQLSDANHQWVVQWESLQRSHESEIERLNEVIRTFKEQEAKRQIDIDKILLSAKRRHCDAEDAKEEALAQLAQITGQLEELKAQYEELKSHLVKRTQEKSDLETELVNLKAQQLTLSQTNQTKSKKESKSSDKKLIQQLKTDLQVLQQQLKIFEEDFAVERRDRAKAQSEKDKLKEELEILKTEKIKLAEKLKESQQYQQAHYMNRHQGQQPKAQPETDPYAQPFTPNMMLRYNNQPNTVNAPGHFQQASGEWNCEFCTFVNHPQRVICEICGTRKGQGRVSNRYSSQGNPGQRQQNPYIPGDICIDSGSWMVDLALCACCATSETMAKICSVCKVYKTEM